jgi:hypothetical protein
MFAEEVQAFHPAGRRQDLIAVTGQDGLQEVAVHTVVIDDKNLDHVAL